MVLYINKEVYMEKKCLSLYDFVTLMLIHLAKKSQIIDIRYPHLKYACFPFAYKEIIQNILCAENRWKEMFSTLINVNEYFDDHFGWEIEMSNALDKVIKNMGKTVTVDFVRDKFIITFTNDEITNLIKQYPNEEINNSVDHFTNLLNDYIYTRYFKEELDNYSSISVEKMRVLRDKKISKY